LSFEAEKYNGEGSKSSSYLRVTLKLLLRRKYTPPP